VSDIVLAARVSARVMPRHCSDSSPPDLIRWSMLRCSLRAPVEALRERDFCMDARVKPGHDGEGKERKKIRRRNADRRNGRSPCRTGTAAPPYGRRTSIGVPPRFLLRRPNATAQLQSALPGMGARKRALSANRPVSVQRSSSQTGRSAGRAGTRSRPGAFSAEPHARRSCSAYRRVDR